MGGVADEGFQLVKLGNDLSGSHDVLKLFLLREITVISLPRSSSSDDDWGVPVNGVI